MHLWAARAVDPQAPNGNDQAHCELITSAGLNRMTYDEESNEHGTFAGDGATGSRNPLGRRFFATCGVANYEFCRLEIGAKMRKLKSNRQFRKTDP